MHPPIKDPLIGTTVDDRFRILAGIGQGATSSVYKAEELSTGQTVAVKILHSHLCANNALVGRFEREAQAAKILVHPNIVAVNEYAVAANGTPYLVMDYVDGISLQQMLISDEWLPLSVALPIFIQVCAALNVAHQAGIVHRDLKPGNIMLAIQDDGTRLVKILDFGCAMVMPLLGDTVLKITQTGEMLGSLLYMSPEQCLDQDVDARSDCYALACVMYETLTGKPPLSARTAFETMNKQLSVMPDSLARVRPDLVFPKELEKIIFKAMAKSPAKRYQNIVEFMDALINLSDKKSTIQQDVRSERREQASSWSDATSSSVSRQPDALNKKIESVKIKIETLKSGTTLPSFAEHQVGVRQFFPSKEDLQKSWEIHWPYFFIVATFLSITLYPKSIIGIAIAFWYYVIKSSVDPVPQVSITNEVKKRQFKSPQSRLHKTWKIFWPYVCLAATIFSIMCSPTLLPFVAIIFGVVFVKTVVDERKKFTTIAEAEMDSGEITLPSLEKQDLTYKLAHLAPLAKLEIIVHDARKSFTYTSGDSLISMNVSVNGSAAQEIIVRPVFQRSFFWDTICEEAKNIKAAGEVFEAPAYITKSTDKNWNVIVIKANQATIVETVALE